jgi:signal transduction histidine kinase
MQDAFLSLASHEVRTPITSFKGVLQLLLKHLAKPPLNTETLRDYAERALRQSQRLEGLVNDLVEVSRLQQGKYTLHPEAVTLQRLVAQAVEVAQVTTTRHTIQVELTSEPLVVLGDAGRLEQVLLNLLTNAIRYVPAGERIVVRLERVGHEARLQVHDTGPGIGASDLAQLFTRFYQGAQSGQGLGLGLYITRELVTAHGGRITVESVEGQGTTFTIALPLLDDEAELVRSRSATRPSPAE